MNTVLFLIIGIPLIEIYLFIKIGSQIGAFNTVLLILITAVAGVSYARYEGFNTLKSGMSQLIKNEMPIYELISGATLAFAALLLIFPGFATDLVGVLLVLPITRRLILEKFIKKKGISIYETKSLKKIYNTFDPDIIQLPSNIFDQRFIKSIWFKKLKNDKKEVHLRSIFLQGLLLEKKNTKKIFKFQIRV